MELTAGRRTVILWQIRVGFIFILLAAAVSPFGLISFWGFMPTFVFAFLGIIAVFWYLPCYFKGFSLTLDKNGIVVRGGVFIKVTRLMPFLRLIYIKSFRTPLSAALGLTGLSLKAARGILIVPELEAAEVAKLMKKIGEENEKDL